MCGAHTRCGPGLARARRQGGQEAINRLRIGSTLGNHRGRHDGVVTVENQIDQLASPPTRLTLYLRVSTPSKSPVVREMSVAVTVRPGA